jgi:hypothetical protein
MGVDIDKIEFNLKSVIALVLWICSILGVYYTMKSKVDELEDKTIRLESKIEKYNPEIIEYKVTNIEKELTKINEKADRIQNILLDN